MNGFFGIPYPVFFFFQENSSKIVRIKGNKISSTNGYDSIAYYKQAPPVSVPKFMSKKKLLQYNYLDFSSKSLIETFPGTHTSN